MLIYRLKKAIYNFYFKAIASGGLGAFRSGFTAGIAGIPGPTGLSLQQASALATQAAYNGALPAT